MLPLEAGHVVFFHDVRGFGFHVAWKNDMRSERFERTSRRPGASPLLKALQDVQNKEVR